MNKTMTRRVLIVDDDPDDIEIATIALEASDLGVVVDAASNGKRALELLRTGEDLPGLILLDLKMPGMSGIDTLREIRSDARLKKIPVVIVTSSLLESDRKAAYDAGADSFVHKAFDISRFNQDMNSLLKLWL